MEVVEAAGRDEEVDWKRRALPFSNIDDAAKNVCGLAAIFEHNAPPFENKAVDPEGLLNLAEEN